MKTIRKILSAAVIMLAAAFPLQLRGQTEVSVDIFYTALEPHGEWFETAEYGYVWHPAEVDETWQPYTEGQWVFTDAGWTWVSEEPWGWATYHYGRWVSIENEGWVWIPDSEWAPAWVSWRHSDDYVGWAPLPPEARFRHEVGFSAWVDAYYDIGPAYYSFVEVRNFGAPRLRTVIVPPTQNITIINKTVNITNITYRNNVVFVGGPEYEVVSKVSVQPIRRLKLERNTTVNVTNVKVKNVVEGDRLTVMAPTVNVADVNAKPRRISKRVEKVNVRRGWEGAGDPAQVEQFRSKIRAEAKPPKDLPKQPRFERAAARGDRQAGREAQAGASPAADAAAEASPAASPEEETKRDRKGKRDRKAGAGASPAADAMASPEASPAASPDASPRERRKRDRDAAGAATPGADAMATPDANADATPGASPRERRKRDRDAAGAMSSPASSPAATPDASPEVDASGATPGAPGRKRKGPREQTDAPAMDTSAGTPADAPVQPDRPDRKRRAPGSTPNPPAAQSSPAADSQDPAGGARKRPRQAPGMGEQATPGTPPGEAPGGRKRDAVQGGQPGANPPAANTQGNPPPERPLKKRKVPGGAESPAASPTP
jgi:hypothetical protein